MRKIILFTIALVATIMVSCGGKKEETHVQKKIADDSIDVRIGVMPGMDCMPFFVAKERGLFDKQNIKVRLVMFNAQMDVDTALVGGSIDFAVTDKYRVEQLQKKGVSLQQWGPSATQWVLVANRRSRLNSVEQMGGKLVAMTRFSATANLCENVFASLVDNPPYYIQINDVKIRTKMLNNGEIDAAWLQEPQVTMCLSKGNNIVSTENNLGELGEFVYRVKSRYTPAKGEKLRTVYNEACDSINKNGIKSYSNELQKFCGADTLAIRKLSSFKFIKQ